MRNYKVVTIPVDVPRSEWKPMQEDLESKGYIIVGQHDGGDLGSALIMANPDLDEEHRDEIMADHDKHLANLVEWNDYKKKYWRCTNA